jgi:hypothetical protein
MATAATLGYQTYLKHGIAGSPISFATIAEVRRIGSFGSKRGLVDVTNMDSPDSAKEFILALKDGVEFTVVANWLSDTTQDAIIAAHDAGTLEDFQMDSTLGGWQFDFSALVLGWEVSPEPEKQDEITFTFKVSGPIQLS